MKYVINILEEQKQSLEQENNRTQKFIEIHENFIKKLQNENVKELIKIADIQQKIDYIKTDEIINRIKNNPSN